MYIHLVLSLSSQDCAPSLELNSRRAQPIRPLCGSRAPVSCRARLPRRAALLALIVPTFLSFALSGQADAAFELWQTGCLSGTVFALRVSLVRMQQARRKSRPGQDRKSTRLNSSHLVIS